MSSLSHSRIVFLAWQRLMQCMLPITHVVAEAQSIFMADAGTNLLGLTSIKVFNFCRF
jgi:hypothetical protein